MEKAEDFFSDSTSLLIVLCYLDHKDILNCKLVSQRLNDVIRRNEIYLPRPNASMMLYFLEGNSINIKLYVGDELSKKGFKKWHCFISEKQSFSMENNCADHAISKLLSTSELNTGNTFDDYCQTSSLLCDLQTILGIMLRRYYVNVLVDNLNMNASPAVQEQYLAVLSHQIKATRSKCNRLSLKRIAWSVLKKIQSQMEISCVLLEFMSVLPQELLSNLVNRHVSYDFDPLVPADIKYILLESVISSWQSGECCFARLRMTSTARYQPERPETFDVLHSRQWFDMKCSQLTDSSCRIWFRRQHDSRFLLLHIIILESNEHESISFYETDGEY